MSIDPGGRCAASASHDLLVLACALSPAHDEGFDQSRELSRAFCRSVEDAVALSAVDRGRLASLCDELFASTRWSGWHLSFGVVENREGRLQAFNCGLVGVAVHSGLETVSMLLDPHTLGRQLRRDGVTSVPAAVEHIGVGLAGKGMPPGDIAETSVEWATDAAILATAEPRLLASLSALGTAASSSDALRDTIENALDGLVNPTRAYVLWSPHARHTS